MCGICGIFDLSGRPINRDTLAKMNSVIRHRGPDGEGELVDQEVGLGHRRLSIIDVDGGGQPLGNEDGSMQIVYNGEIYNFIELRDELEKAGHTFKTKSDTEVVVHAYEQWGAACVKHFNGMFAFAIWDSCKRALFIARDHLGIAALLREGWQPVTVRLEIKTLSASGMSAALEEEALAELFTFRYVPSPKTLFKGIKKLPPAHSMTVSKAGVQIGRFWDWVPRQRKNAREEELVEEYQSLLEDAVRLQMRSDVPLGLFLSSGVDSGLLLAIMSKYSKGPVRAFTYWLRGGEKTNEVEDARPRPACLMRNMISLTPDDYVKYYERYMWDLESRWATSQRRRFTSCQRLRVGV
jgi:asparagine synthase (glutamine-hydrolysing)